MMPDVRSPEVKSNWLRLFMYFPVLIVGILLFYIPLFLEYPDLLSLPRAEYDELLLTQPLAILNQLAMLAGIVSATYFMVSQIEYRALRSIKLNFHVGELVRGGAIALGIMLLFAMLAALFNVVHISYRGFSFGLLYSFLFYFLVAFSEEVLFRGYVLNNLLEKLNPLWAVFFSSVFFGLFHYGNNHFTWIGCLTISLSGFLMGLLTLKGTSLSGAIGCHWIWNFVQGPVLGFAVSGKSETGVVKITPFSHDALTGGAFGAEGSLLLAGLTTAGAFWVWANNKKNLSKQDHYR